MARKLLPLFTITAGALAACTGRSGPAGVTPADVPALEAERAKHPTDPELMTRLGIAYFRAQKYELSRDVLQAALALKKSYTATIFLGLDYEELGDLASARATYNAAAGLTTSDQQKGEIRDRLALLTRKDLQQAARNALAQEATLTQQPPAENTLAVFQFRYVGTDENLAPLGKGVTHLVITDLSKVERLRLLERERVQYLVDEMQLAQAGLVDPATGARSGLILRASSVVQGSLQDVPTSEELKLDAAVVNASNAAVVANGTASDPLQRLFDAEKQVVLQLLQRMGITLTPAEQRAISERPTADLQAFLAFSQGLDAEDRGDFQAAQASFNAAVARDPNFRAASERGAAAQRLSDASQFSALQLASFQSGGPAPVLASGTRIATLRNAVTGTVPTTTGALNRQVNSQPLSSQPPLDRPPLQEALHQDNPISPGLTGSIIIIITRP